MAPDSSTVHPFQLPTSGDYAAPPPGSATGAWTSSPPTPRPRTALAIADRPRQPRQQCGIRLSQPSRAHLEWEQGASDIVATLRTYAGENPLDKGLTDLIGELVTRSGAFRHHWSAQNVRFHRTGIKHIHHPDVGDLEFAYEAMELPDTPGWTMFG
ncbi:hypothetical protein AB0E01_08735 [Nocardia vinacea]|uniref:MmyB family transcriptional regulator n=1 Tax=Nocardia vinacea TaxID=96468 RepID=UPI0033FE4E1C